MTDNQSPHLLNWALETAIMERNLEHAKQSIRQGAEVNQYDYNRGSLVHLAGKDTAMIRLLVENGASMATRNSAGLSPLHELCRQASRAPTPEDFPALCKAMAVLVDLGADCDLYCTMAEGLGFTPLDLVAGTLAEIPLRQAITEREKRLLQIGIPAPTQERNQARERL